MTLLGINVGVQFSMVCNCHDTYTCTRIHKFQYGLARFTKLPANSDSTGEKVLKNVCFLNRNQFLHRMTLWPHFEYRVPCHFSNRTPKLPRIVTVSRCEPGIKYQACVFGNLTINFEQFSVF